MPEFIDPFFSKTSLNRSFSVIENERCQLVFAKTGSINSGTDLLLYAVPVFENDPKSDLIQNKLKEASLGTGTDWIEYERVGLIFTKTIIFTPKTGSINSGTGPIELDPDLFLNLKSAVCRNQQF